MAAPRNPPKKMLLKVNSQYATVGHFPENTNKKSRHQKEKTQAYGHHVPVHR